MYTEIIKIIEGGLVGDKEKVANYAAVLAKNLEQENETGFAKKIWGILKGKKAVLCALDGFATGPVDSESRLEIVEVTTPHLSSNQIVLSKYLEEELNAFFNGYSHRDSLMRAGLELSNSLLLYGPPGCGKTTIAKYISTVTSLPLVTARLDGLVSSLLGSTAKNIRKIFDYASRRECILFLDEFDVVAKLRDDKNELGELKRVVNSLIQNIDSFNSNSILIAATNHHELLDPAIWRRFTKIINLNKPQSGDIQKLISLLLQDAPTDIRSNDKHLSRLTAAFIGLSHSDIKTITTNAVRNAIIQSKNNIGLCDVLREIYLYTQHGLESEDDFIQYLMRCQATHKEISETLGISLRKIRSVSKPQPQPGCSTSRSQTIAKGEVN